MIIGTFTIKLNNLRQVLKGDGPKEEFLTEFTSCKSVVEMIMCMNQAHTKLAQSKLIKNTNKHEECKHIKEPPKSLQEYCWSELKLPYLCTKDLTDKIDQFTFKKPEGCANYELEYRETHTSEETQYGKYCTTNYQGQWIKETSMKHGYGRTTWI